MGYGFGLLGEADRLSECVRVPGSNGSRRGGCGLGARGWGEYPQELNLVWIGQPCLGVGPKLRSKLPGTQDQIKPNFCLLEPARGYLASQLQPKSKNTRRHTTRATPLCPLPQTHKPPLHKDTTRRTCRVRGPPTELDRRLFTTRKDAIDRRHAKARLGPL